MDYTKFLESWGEEIMSTANEKGIDGPLDRAHALLCAHRDDISIDVVKKAVSLFNRMHELEPTGNEAGVLVRGNRWVVRCAVKGLIALTPMEQLQYEAQRYRSTPEQRRAAIRLNRKIYPPGHPQRRADTPPAGMPVIRLPEPPPHVHGPACDHGHDVKADMAPEPTLPETPASNAEPPVGRFQFWKKAWWRRKKK